MKRRIFPKKGEILLFVYENGKYKSAFKILDSRRQREYIVDERYKYKNRCLRNIRCIYNTHKSYLNNMFDVGEDYIQDVFIDPEYTKKTFATAWWEYPDSKMLDKIMLELL